jgi:hypothetical protein
VKKLLLSFLLAASPVFAQTFKSAPEDVVPNAGPAFETDAGLSAPIPMAASLSAPLANEAPLGAVTGLTSPALHTAPIQHTERSEGAQRSIPAAQTVVRQALRSAPRVESATGEQSSGLGTRVFNALFGRTTPAAPSSLEKEAIEVGSIDSSLGTSAVPVSVPSISRAPNQNGRSYWSAAFRPLRALTFGAALSIGTLVAHVPTALGQTPPAAVQVDPSKQADYYSARSINDAVKSWSKDTHLYVVGDVSLSRSTLRSIEASLKGTHWTVILVGDSSGQTYRDAEGNDHYGDDAVDFATGQALTKQDGWSSLRNPRTGEQDASHFTLVLRQHKLYYQGSEAQNGRGLGKEHFKGDLDQWAINAMRSGGKIEQAVTSTINHIDERLNAAIDAEASQATSSIASAKDAVSRLESAGREFKRSHPEKNVPYDLSDLRSKLDRAQAKLDAKKPSEAVSIAGSVRGNAEAAIASMSSYETTLASARGDVDSAESQVNLLSNTVEAFKSAHPKVASEITRPDIESMRGKIVTARQALRSGDTAVAAKIASEVSSNAKSSAKPLEDYEAAKGRLDTLDERLAALKGRAGASAATGEIRNAGDELHDARQAYDAGSIGYDTRIGAAEDAVQGAQKAVDAAEARDAAARERAAAARMALIIFLSLLTAGLFLLGLLLHHRVTGPRDATKKLLADWKAALDEKLNLAYNKLQERADKWCETHPWEGESAEKMKQTKEDVDYAFILWGSAKYVYGQAAELAKPSLYSYFFPDRLKRAQRLLDEENGEKIHFNPDDEEALKIVFGQSDNYKKKLSGKLKDFQKFEGSLSDLMKEYNTRVVRADEALDELEKSVFGGAPAIEKMEQSIAESAKSKEALDKAGTDGLFLAPSIYSKLLPSASQDVAKTKVAIVNNPIGSLKTTGSDAERKAAEASALSDLILKARSGPLAAVAQGVAALKAGGIQTRWIDAKLKELSDAAETMAVDAATASISDRIAELKKNIGEFADKVGRAVDLEKAYRETALPSIAAAVNSVDSTRQKFGAAFELDADKMLREKDSDPTPHLEASAEQAKAAKASLDRGDTSAARKALDESAKQHDEAVAIVAQASAAFDAQEKTVEARRAETSRIEGLVPDAEVLLAKITKKFAPSVLGLGAGDAAHPNANGTVSDNIDETNEQLVSAKSKLDKSIAEFKAGRVLAAASLLRQIAGHQELALHRLGEITEKDARLTRALSDNAALYDALEKRVVEYKTSVAGDFRVMQPTIDAYVKASQEVRTARLAVQAEKGDPFQAAAELAAAQAALAKVKDDYARNDIDIYNEADRSLKAASSALATSKDLERKAKSDDIPDSPGIISDYQMIARLESQLTTAQGSLKVPHNDWHSVDQEADRIANELGRVAASLRGELQHAQEAASSISSASTKVRSAGSWTGGYGVTIPGTPGSGELSRARAALERGDYAEAERAASRAASVAAAAIAEAERLVAQREEEERQRREAERRRREEEEAARRRRAEEEEESRRRSSSSSDSGSSWGSSSSGNSGSNWSSSGSGNGSSGW